VVTEKVRCPLKRFGIIRALLKFSPEQLAMAAGNSRLPANQADV
jgi:hypothetical protein